MTACCHRTARAALAVLIGLAVGSPLHAQTESADVEYVRADATRALGLPFSDLVRVGDVLYLSGRVGVRPGTLKLVEGGIEAETREILDSMRALLAANGSSLDHVFKCTVMIADMGEWSRFNAVYVTYFDEARLPARSALGANGLALGASVELECLATVAATP